MAPRWRAAGAAALVATVALVPAACSDDESGSPEELCRALRSQPALSSTFDGFDPTDVPAALEQLRSARVTLGELRDAAPSEVKDDLSVEIDYVQALIDGLEPLEAADSAEVVATVRAITADHPDVEAAAATLAAYSEETCAREG